MRFSIFICVFFIQTFSFFQARYANSQTSSNIWENLPEQARTDLVKPLSNQDFFYWYSDEFSEWKTKRESIGKSQDFAQFYFENVLGREERRQLMLVYAKLSAEKLWKLVGKIKWAAGHGGSILFEPVYSQANLISRLKENGYGDWWMASSSDTWGMRSRFSGAQLHFRGGDYVNVHIDLHNPGDDKSGEPSSAVFELGTAIRHLWSDLVQREETHSFEEVARALKEDGIEVIVPIE